MPIDRSNNYSGFEERGSPTDAAPSLEHLFDHADAIDETVANLAVGQGAQGPQGIQGEIGPQGPAGADGTSFDWAGTWSAVTAYVVDQVVGYEELTYISIQNGTNKQPDIEGDYWDLFPIQGVQGPVGATGAQGATGATGAQGPQGPAGAAGDASTAQTEPDIAYLKSIATNLLTGGFGVAGNGSTNDTAAISAAITACRAATLNVWSRYHVLYAPGATYRIRDLNRSAGTCDNLLIIGDGDKTIFQRVAGVGNIPIGDWQTATHLRLMNFAIDQVGLTAFGGWKFYQANDVIIENLHIYDSVNKGGGLMGNAQDLYGILFGKGSATSKNIVFRNNLIEDLQCEFDHCQRCLIEDNTSIRSPTSCALGSFALAGGSDIMEDYTVRNNTVIDAYARPISFTLDTSGTSNSVCRRINIYGNQIRWQGVSATASAIRIGSGNTTWPLTGIVFEDISIVANRIAILKTGTLVTTPTIYVSIGALNAFTLEGGEISQNIIEGSNMVDDAMIDVDYVRDFLIDSNVLTGCRNQGINVASAGTTDVSNNIVTMTGAAPSNPYVYSGLDVGSLGNNTFVNNRWRGSPFSATGLSNAGSDTGDSIAAPTSANTGNDMLWAQKTHDWGDLAAGDQQSTTVSVFGALIGSPASASFSLSLANTYLRAEVTATDTVTVTQMNPTAGAINVASGTLKALVIVR
jgi:hypothetical protein